jgi:hypothetical protein
MKKSYFDVNGSAAFQLANTPHLETIHSIHLEYLSEERLDTVDIYIGFVLEDDCRHHWALDNSLPRLQCTIVTNLLLKTDCLPLHDLKRIKSLKDKTEKFVESLKRFLVLNFRP